MSKNQFIRNIHAGLTKGYVNAYVCPELHTIITKNRDNGFIPDKIFCPKCDQHAISLYYQVNQNLSPQIEFFKPSQAETQSALLSMKAPEAKGHLQYINDGGLVSRLIEPKTFTKDGDS